MTVTTDQLSERLSSAFGTVAVDELGPGAFRVLIPTGRMAHDWTTIAVEQVANGEWVLSDAGQTAHLLGSDFDSIAELMECAGAPFAPVSSDQLVASCTDDRLVETLLSYAHHLVAVPVVWQAQQCWSAGASAARTAPIIVMARSMRARIAERLAYPSHRGFLHVDRAIVGRGMTTRCPLTIDRTPQSKRPELVASFVDTTTTRSSVTNAERSASFLYQVLEGLEIPKYLVVRGSAERVETYGAFYDEFNVTTLSEDVPDLLLDQAAEVIGTLVGME